jgi:ATP-dependent DNA helicase RecG
MIRPTGMLYHRHRQSPCGHFRRKPYFCCKTAIATTTSILHNPIEYLKGVGPNRADLLRKELQVFTFGDLLELYPYRHIDKTQVSKIADIKFDTEFIQVAGVLTDSEVMGSKGGRRLVAHVRDGSGVLELVWFQGIPWVQKMLETGQRYLIFGRTGFYMGSAQMTHPEMELFQPAVAGGKAHLDPVYPSTEKLKARGLSGKAIGKLTAELMKLIRPADLPENIPEPLLRQLKLIPRLEAYIKIHFPASEQEYAAAQRRIKFEELFLAQVRLQLLQSQRHRFSKGVVLEKVGDFFNGFYNQYLPFALTGAQKRVIKEIRADMGRGRQMNRLLQGDVGSGKTMVALLCMLIAADNGFQSCLMAPTEILARQHYEKILQLLLPLGVNVALLTGSTKAAQRKKLHTHLLNGDIHILIGTHALIEDKVQYHRLGLAVIDEQHRFGVAQRASLWKKSELPPHILVMTATPIPRTLAMTAYGDLDTSVIDELPPGRKPIETVHRYENVRSQVMTFIKAEIAKGRQAYIVFPLIEESEKMDYENLRQGYENVKAYFPEPQYWISMVHGKMPPAQKDTNMSRFVQGDTQIMVSTTVIEVGVDVPNASVMVIESAEKFGLSQLHQLRGRVGRGAEKSFCILLTGSKLSNDAKERLKIMTGTNDGFKIAEKDLELRGPGDIEGTRQSGALNFKMADIVNDKKILETARNLAAALVEEDPDLNSAANLCLKHYLVSQKGKTGWSRIS